MESQLDILLHGMKNGVDNLIVLSIYDVMALRTDISGG